MKKRQRRRKAATALFTTKHVFMLIVLSLGAYLAFRVWVGNPSQALCGDDCESMYSLLGWVLGFLLLFVAVAAAGGLVGVIVSLIRRSRNDENNAFAARYMSAQPESEGTSESMHDREPAVDAAAADKDETIP